MAVDQHAPGVDVVEARDEVENRRLARARRPDERRRPAPGGRQRDVGECRRAAAVAEAHALEGDRARAHDERARAGAVANGRLGVEDGIDPLGGGETLLHADVEVGEALHRLVGEQQRRDEREEGPRRRRAGDHLRAAVEDDHGDGDAAQVLHDRRRQRAHAQRLVEQAIELLDRAAGAADLVVLHAVGLDVARALHRFVEQRRQPPDLRLRARRDAAHAPADLRDRKKRDREQHHRGEREAPFLIEHHGDEEDDREALLDHAGERGRDRRAQEAGVVGEPRDERARGGLVVEGEIGADEVREHAVLHVGDDALADAVHQHGLAVARHALGEEDRDDDERQDHEHRAVLVGEDLVEHRLHQVGVGGGRRGDDGHARDGEPEAGDVGANLFAHESLEQGAGWKVCRRRRCRCGQRERRAKPSARVRDHSTAPPPRPATPPSQRVVAPSPRRSTSTACRAGPAAMTEARRRRGSS